MRVIWVAGRTWTPIIGSLQKSRENPGSRRPYIACANCKCHGAQQYLNRKSRPQKVLGMGHRQMSTGQKLNGFASNAEKML